MCEVKLTTMLWSVTSSEFKDNVPKKFTANNNYDLIHCLQGYWILSELWYFLLINGISLPSHVDSSMRSCVTKGQ